MVITLGAENLERSRRFYVNGFGWIPAFENEEIIFYQMNGLVLGTWLTSALAADSDRASLARPGAFALAHNVATKEDVEPVMGGLVEAGGRQLKAQPIRHMEALPAMSRSGRACLGNCLDPFLDYR